MRVKSISFISVVVIVGSLAWLVATPMMRESIRESRIPPTLTHFRPRLERQVRQRPKDANAWFALAVASEDSENTSRPNMGAFQRVFDLKPRWPAPYLALGGMLTSQVPEVWRSELAAFNPAFATQAERQKTPLTAQQRELIRRARQVLDKARSLDPVNAAPDYLLAFLALMEHRDDHALALLRSGITKNHWSLGQREASIAVYQTAARSLPAVQAFSFTLASSRASFDLYPRLRELDRIVIGEAVLAQQRGDVERAVFLRRSMLHLGRLMIEQGYAVTDVLVGAAIWHIATSEHLTRAEEAEVARSVAPQKGVTTSDETQLVHRAIMAVERERVARYLRQYGHADLANHIISYGSELTTWLDRMRETFRSGLHGSWYRWVYALIAVAGAVMAGFAGLIVLIVCGIVRLAVSRRRGWPRPITWARWKWALVAVACLAVPFAVTLALARSRSAPPYVRPGATSMATMGLVVGVLLLAITAALITWRARRRLARSERPGFGRHYAATLTAVMLPTTALLLLLAVVLSFPAASGSRRFTRHQEIIIYQGELKYLGLRPPAGPTQ
jgi:hypothetical protein